METHFENLNPPGNMRTSRMKICDLIAITAVVLAIIAQPSWAEYWKLVNGQWKWTGTWGDWTIPETCDPVTSKEECEAVARELGLKSEIYQMYQIGEGVTNHTARLSDWTPPYCSYRTYKECNTLTDVHGHSSSGCRIRKHLWFNEYVDGNTDTEPCFSHFICVCKNGLKSDYPPKQEDLDEGYLGYGIYINKTN